MHFFSYKKNKLHAEEVPVEQIIKEVGTPVYIYSHQTLKRHFEVFTGAFEAVPHQICFSMKSNANLAILRAIGNLGGGVDIVSGGELFRALKAEIPAERIVYSGVGKTRREMAEALKAGILLFNVESSEELKVLAEVAGKLRRKAPISLRVNPNIDPKTHPYISTGLKKSKFGIDIKQALAMYLEAKKMKNIEILGVDCHIGSQLTELKPFVDALKKLKELITELRRQKINIRYLDLGGGLGIRYQDETPPSPAEYADALIKELKDFDLKLIFEPGRVLVGNAGILVTEVLYTKQTEAKHFVIVDAAMNDLVRPAFYGSYHGIEPITKGRRRLIKTDVVGPICESGDFFAQDREMASVTTGEHLAIFSAGAYGFSMASNYNSRPRAAEVLVSGSRFAVIRKRESLEDLIHGESIPKFL